MAKRKLMRKKTNGKKASPKPKLAPVSDVPKLPPPTKEDYERLATLKALLKKTEETVKELQKQIIDSGGVKEVETKLGVLKLQSRENWEVLDMEQVLDVMGSTSFLEHCKISKSGITKGIGDRGFKQLAAEGAVTEKEKSSYYLLKKKKK